MVHKIASGAGYLPRVFSRSMAGATCTSGTSLGDILQNLTRRTGAHGLDLFVADDGDGNSACVRSPPDIGACHDDLVELSLGRRGRWGRRRLGRTRILEP